MLVVVAAAVLVVVESGELERLVAAGSSAETAVGEHSRQRL